MRLADGRELIYFDDRPVRRRGAPDLRALPSAAGRPGSQARYDPLLDEWVVIAAHRQGRTHLPADDECPLCPSRPGRLTEIPEEDYDVVVFENRFPALSLPGGAAGALVGGGEEPFTWRPGAGRCEVVCFTAEHTTSFAQLAPTRVATVLAAWTDRTAALSALPAVESVFVFENRGAEIGVTLSHPHGQIYAYPFVPPPLATMIQIASRRRACGHCAALAAESKARVRVVAETSGWLAFVPYAARWPYEVSICPRRHVPDLLALDEDERAEFPGLYLDVLNRFERVLGGGPMPYIAAWEQTPVRHGREWAHLRLRVFSNRRAPGRLKYLAGSEAAMGVYLNDVTPEVAAERLRAAGGAPLGAAARASG